MKKVIQTLSILSATCLVALALALGITSHQPAYADAKSSACEGVGLVTGSPSAGCGSTTSSNKRISDIVATVINILSLVVGIVAVIMIVVGGLRFVLSGGDANNTNAARNSIIYAIVGLVIVAIAQSIVHFVLNKIK